MCIAPPEVLCSKMLNLLLIWQPLGTINVADFNRSQNFRLHSDFWAIFVIILSPRSITVVQGAPAVSPDLIEAVWMNSTVMLANNDCPCGLVYSKQIQ